MNLLHSIKARNKHFSSSIVGTDLYWQKSPSNLLLKHATEAALKQFAQGKSVLDAGAGRLAYRDLIKKYAKKYISSDFKKTHPDLDVITDIENLKFKDQDFDVVFCSQVLEHVPHPWLAFKEIHRVLKPKGIAIITVPMLGYIHNAPYDFYRYTRYGLETLGQDAGFFVVSIKPLGGFFCFLGYTRSTLLMSLFSIPLLGKLFYWLNYLFSRLDIMLDQVTRNSKVFPLNYVLIVKKQ